MVDSKTKKVYEERQMKKQLLILTLAALLLAGCGGRIVHCDGCGKALRVSDSSNVDESRTILCRDCEKKAQLGE